MVRIYEPMTSIAPEELVAEQRKQISLVGSQRRIPGLRLYEYDLTTGEVREASVENEASLRLDGPVGTTGRVDVKELCLYVQALNETVAVRKFRAMLRRRTVRDKVLGKKCKPNSNDSHNG